MTNDLTPRKALAKLRKLNSELYAEPGPLDVRTPGQRELNTNEGGDMQKAWTPYGKSGNPSDWTTDYADEVAVKAVLHAYSVWKAKRMFAPTYPEPVMTASGTLDTAIALNCVAGKFQDDPDERKRAIPVFTGALQRMTKAGRLESSITLDRQGKEVRAYDPAAAVVKKPTSKSEISTKRLTAGSYDVFLGKVKVGSIIKQWTGEEQRWMGTAKGEDGLDDTFVSARTKEEVVDAFRLTPPETLLSSARPAYYEAASSFNTLGLPQILSAARIFKPEGIKVTGNAVYNFWVPHPEGGQMRERRLIINMADADTEAQAIRLAKRARRHLKGKRSLTAADPYFHDVPFVAIYASGCVLVPK